jgi:coproporphyrinogen III oxidase-like Fe-S oxidoreductase
MGYDKPVDLENGRRFPSPRSEVSDATLSSHILFCRFSCWYCILP